MSRRWIMACVSAAHLLTAACAGPGARGETAPSPAAGAAPTAAPYERILGSLTVDPDVVVLLSPALCERHCSSWRGEHDLVGLADTFAGLGYLRGEAAASINAAAVLWRRGNADRAYQRVMHARRRFAESGDVNGMAHAFEWLGYMFLHSNEKELAAEHLSVAYTLFEGMGNQPAMARVLAYGAP